MSVEPRTPADAPRLRIGELSNRTGVAADTLRAWERRYGVLRPERSEGGFRLYGREDEQRVRAMKALIESGASAAEAARLASTAAPASPEPAAAASGPPPEAGPVALLEALERFDEAAANAVLDESLSRLTVDAVLDRVVLPVMREIGRRWQSGTLTVGQEHFATAVVRGRMLALARNWGAGVGPLALLACPPSERHDLGLLAFGVVLHDRGWRIAYFGPDTPIETIAASAAGLGPTMIVLASMDRHRFESFADEIGALARDELLLVAGAGANAELARRLGVEALEPDPVGAAIELASPEATAS